MQNTSPPSSNKQKYSVHKTKHIIKTFVMTHMYIHNTHTYIWNNQLDLCPRAIKQTNFCHDIQMTQSCMQPQFWSAIAFNTLHEFKVEANKMFLFAAVALNNKIKALLFSLPFRFAVSQRCQIATAIKWGLQRKAQALGKTAVKTPNWDDRIHRDDSYTPVTHCTARVCWVSTHHKCNKCSSAVKCSEDNCKWRKLPTA